MKIAFLVNDIMTEMVGYSTTRLALTATNLGHEVWYISVGDIAYDSDELVRARAVTVPAKKYKTNESYISMLQGKKAKTERITVSELDILMLRNDPSTDATNRPWAKNVGIMFGRVAVRSGVIVLNDPNGLAKAENKMYLQYFPEEVRPKTLITRDNRDVKAFAKEQGGTVVLKPLHGSGGQGVFLVKPETLSNLNQMIDAVSRDGFVIAQEYLPAAVDGDIRLFLMNGLPLRHRGKYAAFRRVRLGDDMRSNIHAG
jgi:glutathione synthase